ncbi:hypothetical protein IVB45_23115 [Bradyrhizobium sp. 4]|uniref:His-rich protein BRANT n=1 Tax=unclassified Bradyrhizobium TaxID=2631580 RepID=UPI001FF93A43|nr:MULTISPECIES: hypothetical protein [unclassified Bradyrhizobium]MCK1402790.1 hypothetical protein [Bradyrhizobium sp. 39]MCK1748385.1 hypothetical protein [Bradyrhizobium sp. 135]UPJ32856.1 hypothetical protein IVB45_23115 [Bradyrhizobium sp. 4]
MLKTISAALLAASVIAAPAFAGETGKTTTTTPVIKADQAQTKVSTTAAKPDAGLKADAKTSDVKASDVKADAKVDAKSKAMNANAAVTPDAHKTVRTHRHHHKHLSAKKSLTTQPDVTKPATMEKRS